MTGQNLVYSTQQLWQGNSLFKPPRKGKYKVEKV